MKTTSRIATTAAMCVLAAVSFTAPASAKPGIHLNGPALDGQKVALPDRLAGTPEVAFDGDGVHLNGPGLDGQKVALPTWLVGTPEVARLVYNGPALDGHNVALPGGPLHARR
jgi:hypothetical protein